MTWDPETRLDADKMCRHTPKSRHNSQMHDLVPSSLFMEGEGKRMALYDEGPRRVPASAVESRIRRSPGMQFEVLFGCLKVPRWLLAVLV